MMAYLLTLLSLLACPLMMGLMMWLMMRAGHGRGDDGAQAATPASLNTSRRGVFGRWCLNWKVVALLSWGVFAVWLVVPSLVWAALPFVIMVACPLSMLLMMRGMGGGESSATREQRGHSDASEGLAALRVQHEPLSRDVTHLEQEQGAPLTNRR
jgi:hypothetical protein